MTWRESDPVSPAAAPPPPQSAASASSDGDGNGAARPPRVVVIDDNPDDRTLAARALRQAFADVDVVLVDGPDALARVLDAGGFDVVVSDYQLRWTTGLDVLRLVNERHPDTPVVFFTNTGSEEVCAEALRNGLFDYILKRPQQYPRLAVAVRAALQSIALRQAEAQRRADRERHERELAALLARERAARAEAERANRLKDEFLAVVSHELRTPLNAILGWAQLLRGDAAEPDDRAHGLETIERNARAQGELIDDLLDMSRIVSGRIRLDVRPVDLVAVLESAMATARPAAAAKGVELAALLDPGAAAVRGDPARLEQVAWNLLSNAVKFTPPGGRVAVRLERVASRAAVVVEDNGVGIDPAFLPHVFDRFRQGDASTTREHGGLGLGLSIAKHLAELHGGTVAAASAGVGRGETFSVSLPIAAVAPEPGRTVTMPTATSSSTHRESSDAAAPGRAARDPSSSSSSSSSAADACPSLAGLHALVVDDDADAVDLLRRVLEQCQATVDTASSTADALARFAHRPPDVLVSDIGMPGEDGYALIGRVRGLPPERGGDVPAVALTAFARTEDRQRALLAGFQVHVSKPVEPTELIAVVASLAGRTGRGRSPA